MTVKDYIELENKSEIDTIIRFSDLAKQSMDTLGIGKFDDWPFDTVKQLQAEVRELSFYRAVFWFDIFGVKDIGDKELFRAIQCYNYLLDQVRRTIELENELLSSHDADFELAGIAELEELGAYLQIRQIAITLGMRIDEVKRMRYADAMLELVAQKRINDFQRRLQEVKMKKGRQE